MRTFPPHVLLCHHKPSQHPTTETEDPCQVPVVVFFKKGKQKPKPKRAGGGGGGGTERSLNSLPAMVPLDFPLPTSCSGSAEGWALGGPSRGVALGGCAHASRAFALRLSQQLAEGVKQFLEPRLVTHALLHHLLLAQVLVFTLDRCRLKETKAINVRRRDSL